MKNKVQTSLSGLAELIKGELRTDQLSRTIYATDASIYKEYPLGVVYPQDEEDLVAIVKYARQSGISLIPRTAGTSLAGQCVGAGLVVDLSRHMTSVLELNQADHWVRVQPGVIRDELNLFLKDHGLMFGPNTATANRCMLGGMVGNNSCGSTSIVYGSTRDHLLAARTVLSDGSVALFAACTMEQLKEQLELPGLEGQIYRQLLNLLQDPQVQDNIRQHYPKASIRRRNNGYAIDTMLRLQPFHPRGELFNMAKLLAGSEGTLGLISELKLNLVKTPPPGSAMLAAHFTSINETLQAVTTIMDHAPYACEMMDKIILDCTITHSQFVRDRQFVVGDPLGMLLVECRADTDGLAETACLQIKESLVQKKQGYAWPVLRGKQVQRAWALRQAGLGLLANLPGEKKAVACIEDTAVDIQDLPAYILEVQELMDSVGQQSIYYAHAGDGELHLRPVLNLRDPQDVKLLRTISHQSAQLVKKYQGSLAGEHGVGRVRGEFLPDFIGADNYSYLLEIKRTWDPQHLFNPGKITDPPHMDTALKNNPARSTPTIFQFEEPWGILGATERCTGSGDCRQLPGAGRGMCPSYQATRQEKDTTRARANALREYISHPEYRDNPWDHPELFEVLDLCLSCKACTHECPASVDITTLKAEWQYQYYRGHTRPWSHYLFAGSGYFAPWASRWPGLTNHLLQGPIGQLLKKVTGLAPERRLPSWSQQPWARWYSTSASISDKITQSTEVVLLADEFINYFGAHIGIAATQLLRSLGYAVSLWPANSGRALMSKGFLKQARKLAETNISQASGQLTGSQVLVGVEPSTILSFKDEYPRLCTDRWRDVALRVKSRTFLIEEFLAQEIRAGHISSAQFTSEPAHLLYHGHCHQKALSDLQDAITCLSIPTNYHVEITPAGCCGLAGTFGYEKEHYKISMDIGELVLFPSIRTANRSKLLVASGLSCRDQIRHGTGQTAQHPVEVLYQALIKT